MYLTWNVFLFFKSKVLIVKSLFIYGSFNIRLVSNTRVSDSIKRTIDSPYKTSSIFPSIGITAPTPQIRMLRLLHQADWHAPSPFNIFPMSKVIYYLSGGSTHIFIVCMMRDWYSGNVASVAKVSATLVITRHSLYTLLGQRIYSVR